MIFQIGHDNDAKLERRSHTELKIIRHPIPCLSMLRVSVVSTVMSLLEAPCAKTSWRALLFRAILGITGALIVCFDIWRFKQVNNSETGFGVHHCDFEQHVPCLTVHVCMNSVNFVLEAPGASILWGRYYSVTMCRVTWGALLLGRALLIGTLRYFGENRLTTTVLHQDCTVTE